MKKAVLGIMLTLLLTGMLALTFDIQQVKAAGTIYIRADGSIKPSTANITSADNITYTFTDNNYDSIVIERDNIVVDGAGFTVQGTGMGTGIDLSFRNNVTLRNVEVTDFSIGIHLWSSNNSFIFGNNASNNYYYGIRLDYSSNNTVTGNTAFNNYYYGIFLYGSSNNTVTGNNASNNRYCGIFLDYFCNNNTVTDNTASNNDGGIRLDYSSNNTVTGNNASNNDYNGIFLDYSSNNTVTGNNVSNNGYGIRLRHSSNNTVTGNTAFNNYYYGIFLDYFSNNNNVTDNDFSNNGYGIRLCHSSNNNVIGNNVSNNEYGIYLIPSGDNTIFHNNFTDNAVQGWATAGYVNTWDDGYPSGGNFWSDYDGVDEYGGEDQNEAGSDGVGDTPYVIDENNTDNYPLMKPYPWDSHDVGITNVKPSKTVVGEGYCMYFDVMVFNYGDYTENFNGSIYANTTEIGTFTDITLTSKTSITVTINCTDVSIAKGNYSISAYINPVPDEADTADNTLTDGIVTVTIPGDVDGDFDVDIYDVVKICSCYGAKEGEPEYEANSDIDGDGDVDIYDIAIMCNHYGETYPYTYTFFLSF